MDTPEQGAMASAVPPLWDKENAEEAGLLCTSAYKDLINKNRVKLCEDLEPDRIWAHLRQLHVLDKVTEERLKFNQPRPDVVLKLLEFIESGPCWRFHGFCRALALTDQSDLIPRGGLKPNVYEEGASHKQLPKNLLRLIRDHCRSNVESLMKTSLFDFEGDPDCDTIDISQCFVPVDPEMKSDQQKMIPIPTKQILEQLHDKVPQVVRMYGDPGDGKTSLMMHMAHCMSAEFLKLTDEELSTKIPRWTTIVYLSAPKIKGTVEEAIRDELGCKEKDADTLQEHVATGYGTGVFIDSLDEVRDEKVIENIQHYVHQRKKKGGPTVLIAARTDLCPIDPKDIDRTINLQGFTEAQGLDYVRLYTEMCEFPQQPEQPPLVEYVTQHTEELKSVLTNPLRLYIFTALAVRGELDLVNERVFNIPKLFGPLERYLLRREGGDITEEQCKEFYRLCMHGLLNGLREFPESLLAEFNIANAYYVFLKRSSRRGLDGALVAYYSFGHEMLYEYFASRYIHSLTTEQKKSLLLSICSNEQLRNVQYIVFQMLLEEWENQKDLIVSMIRCVLILQFTAPEDNVKGKFIDLMSLRYTVQNNSSLNGFLDKKQQDIDIRNSEKIWEEVNNVFDKRADRLQEAGWFGYLCTNGTVNHVIKCLRACSALQQETLFQSTISHLLPCRTWHGAGENGTDYFKVDSSSTRWAQVHLYNEGELALYVWCPSDAYQGLKQYLRKYSGKNISKMRICFNDDILLGKAPESAWSEDEWYRLTSELTALDELLIATRSALPLEGMLSCLADYAPLLEHRMKVTVLHGTVSLGALLSALPRCNQVPHLTLELHPTSVVVPSGHDEKDLIAQRNLVCRIGRVEHIRGCPYPFVNRIMRNCSWVTESGEKYVWSDGLCNSYETTLQFLRQL